MRNFDGKLKKPSLVVHKELPQGVVEQDKSSFRDIREARDSEFSHFYFCPKCKGWIEGRPIRHNVHTLAPLSGRSGSAEDCERCGYELDFLGIVS